MPEIDEQIRSASTHLREGTADLDGGPATLAAVRSRGSRMRRRRRAVVVTATVAALAVGVGGVLVATAAPDERHVDVGGATSDDDDRDTPTTPSSTAPSPPSSTVTSADAAPDAGTPSTTGAGPTTTGPPPPTTSGTTAATTAPPITTPAAPPDTGAPDTTSTTAPAAVSGPLPGEVASIYEAYSRWKANAPAGYTVRMSKSYGSGWTVVADVVVVGTGLGSQVVSATDVATGDPIDAAEWPTLDSLYDIFAGEFGACTCLTVVVATGLPVDGVPSEIRVVDGTGHEFLAVEISGFWPA